MGILRMVEVFADQQNLGLLVLALTSAAARHDVDGEAQEAVCEVHVADLSDWIG